MKKVYVVPHSHWDREWYMPFEHHRARLVALMDSVLELLLTDEYTHYHLDGQMIALEDYLEIRPGRRGLVERLIACGRLHVGPWYVLQDTYLTGSEANVRNLMHGMRMAEQFGQVCRIGYLPDAFGNAGQFPQLLAQAGMKAAVFGRGVGLSGVNGVSDPGRLAPRHSEFLWESPDGTRIPSVYFANWYSNGMEIPTDPEKAEKWWSEKIAAAEEYASTEHLLMMNGCDHQPVQRDLPQALETARALFPDVEFRQSELEAYASAVLDSLETPLEVVRGELEGQYTDGHGTLRNTASARWRIKALNRRNETLLERVAEPLAAMAAMAGVPCDGDLYDYAWRMLMQNHPHDSICGCSVDAVHREMETRYCKSIHMGEWLRDQALTALSERIDAQLPPQEETGAAFAVWNTSAWERSGVVDALIGVERVYGTQDACAALSGSPCPEYTLVRSDGTPVPCRIRDAGLRFGYDLPDDRFRQPYYERCVRVIFDAERVPGFGYETYRLLEGKGDAAAEGVAVDGNALENRFLRAEFAEDGSLTLTDKRTGRRYTGLGVFEDVGDVGDEYVFQQALGAPVTTAGVPARIAVAENSGVRASICVEHTMHIPAAADDALSAAVAAMQPRETRRIGRSDRLTALKIRAVYTLERSARQLNVRVELDNGAKDHRLRMLFPTDTCGDCHYADSVFDLVRRRDLPGEAWVNPSRCDRMQLYAAAADAQGGLGVSNRGLYEYEILDDRRTLAVTLLRAVGEMGDWGVFPTPEAQCPGDFCAELALIPLADESETAEGYRMACLFQSDMPVSVIRNTGAALPARGSFLNWEGNGLICTCLKPAADGEGVVMRLFNPTDEAAEMSLRTGAKVYRSNILETVGSEAEQREDVSVVRVLPREIITLRLSDGAR